MLNLEFWGNSKHLIPISYNLLNLVTNRTHITLILITPNANIQVKFPAVAETLSSCIKKVYSFSLLYQ